MPEWHQLDSSTAMSEQQESANKKTLKSSSRLFWFSTGLLKLCDFIARLWSSIPEPGNFLCLHCKPYYSDSLSHLVAECKCSQPLKERFLHDCRGILPPELVDTLFSADADTFLTIVLSASCWSNLDRAMIDSFLSNSFSFVRSCCRNPCEHS